MLKFNDYQYKIMWHVFNQNGTCDIAGVDACIRSYGGTVKNGNISFEVPEQETFFKLKWES
jgi:hypothetical protein